MLRVYRSRGDCIVERPTFGTLPREPGGGQIVVAPVAGVSVTSCPKKLCAHRSTHRLDVCRRADLRAASPGSGGKVSRRDVSISSERMAQISRVSLFGKLNQKAYKALEGATVFCKLRGNPYVELVHWFQQILQLEDSDLHRIVRRFDIDRARLAQDITERLDRLPRGATSISDLSRHVEYAVERGWVYATLMFGETQVRTGYLLVGCVSTPSLVQELEQMSGQFAKITEAALTDDFGRIVEGSPEVGLGAHDGFSPASAVNASARKPVESPDIFVCYRRDDSLHLTERLFDRLVLALGKDRVFRDIDSIPLGVRDFGEELKHRLTRTRFFLAVIGTEWLGAVDDEGRRRLDDPDDFVRMEIETALQGTAQIIPILVDGAAIPARAKLPESLRPLTRCSALPIRGGPDFEHDLGRLISHFEQHRDA